MGYLTRTIRIFWISNYSTIGNKFRVACSSPLEHVAKTSLSTQKYKSLHISEYLPGLYLPLREISIPKTPAPILSFPGGVIHRSIGKVDISREMSSAYGLWVAAYSLLY